MSSGAQEVSDGTSSANWQNDAIDNVTSSRSTDDLINGNDAANQILSDNGVDQVIALDGDDYMDVADGAGGDTARCGGGNNDQVFCDDRDDVLRPEYICESKTLVP